MDIYKENQIIKLMNANKLFNCFDVNNSNISCVTNINMTGGNNKIHKSTNKKFSFKYNTKNIITYPTKYIKLTRNQLQLLDDIMTSGNSKKYIDTYNKLRYTEQAGILDFDNTKLDKLIISGKTTIQDKYDIDILLPKNMIDALDYEYIFHTHPPTPYAGARVLTHEILYEVPSIADLYHFAYHHNEGNIQGSIIIAPEGIYIIRLKKDIKYIDVPSIKGEKILLKIHGKLQEKAIKKFGHNFTENNQKYFYTKVAQDRTFINEYNKYIQQYFNPYIVIIYKPRIYDKLTKKWIIESLYLKVKPIEIEYK